MLLPPPPPLNYWGITEKILLLPPPPLNRVGFRRSRKRLKKFNKLNLAALVEGMYEKTTARVVVREEASEETTG